MLQTRAQILVRGTVPHRDRYEDVHGVEDSDVPLDFCLTLSDKLQREGCQ